MGQALTVLHRYHAVARAMGAAPFEILATAAVRDARNGADFVAGLQSRLPGVPIRILSGLQEAEFSAMGVLCGIPTPMASWPISAAVRWNWCGSTAARAACRTP